MKPEVFQWMVDIRPASGVMGALLGVIHPDLYDAGIQALRTIIQDPTVVKEHSAVLNLLTAWTSPYSAYSVISNRVTDIHRDVYARPEWYDLLATLGNYSGGRFELPGIGITLDYPPGTLVGICGKVLMHGVPEVNGSRVCIAHYMRDDVHDMLKIPAPSWMKVARYT